MNLKEIQLNIVYKIEKEGLYSYDPYDALTNNFLNSISKRSRLLRRVFIQINARSPINLRWIGMKKMIHTKVLSDMLIFYSIRGEKIKINYFFDELLKRKINHEYGWGLNFPYCSRFTNASSETANLYNTVNAGIAISKSLNLLNEKNKEKATEALNGIFNYLEKYFKFTKENNKGFYAYYPGQTDPTYNVNALVLYFLVHIKELDNVENILVNDRINRIINLLIEEQNNDGSWFYARSNNGKWIDGFHTGFIIESLSFAIYSGINNPGLNESYEKGFNFYIQKMFTSSNYPKYFVSDNIFPIESQNCAQAIQTIASIGIWHKSDHKDKLKSVIKNTIQALYNTNGFFYHKKTKCWMYRTSYNRWSNVPMILALEYSRKFLETDII